MVNDHTVTLHGWMDGQGLTAF